MRIRLANSDDESGIQSVIKSFHDTMKWGWYPQGYHADLFDIQSHYLDRGDSFWVAEMGGTIVGTAALSLFPKIPGDGLVLKEGQLRIGGCDCSLERLYVLESVRGQKVGYRLWMTTREAALLAGSTRQEIWSDMELHPAHALYERSGAVRVGDRKCSDPSEAPEWGMYLEL